MSSEQIDEIATRRSWTTLPIGSMEPIPYEGTFSRSEFATMGRGLIPAEMDDKWFVFLEGASLFFHRSWTGHCVYQVDFEVSGDGVRVSRAKVAMEQEFYRRGPDSYEAAILDYLIRGVLLHQAIRVPQRPTTESS